MFGLGLLFLDRRHWGRRGGGGLGRRVRRDDGFFAAAEDENEREDEKGFPHGESIEEDKDAKDR